MINHLLPRRRRPAGNFFFCSTHRPWHWLVAITGELSDYTTIKLSNSLSCQASKVFNNYTIVACCDGVHSVLYTRGVKWNPRQSQGCHSPSRVYKTQGPQSQRTTIVLLFCIIVIPLLKVLLSSSNIITTNYSFFNNQTNKKQFHRTPGCFVHSGWNRPTLETIIYYISLRFLQFPNV